MVDGEASEWQRAEKKKIKLSFSLFSLLAAFESKLLSNPTTLI
jgi:hypothetical protein